MYIYTGRGHPDTSPGPNNRTDPPNTEETSRNQRTTKPNQPTKRGIEPYTCDRDRKQAILDP